MKSIKVICVGRWGKFDREFCESALEERIESELKYYSNYELKSTTLDSNFNTYLILQEVV